jgi:uncharacterized protein YdeI (YjbR/CyaY-like superfamily)
VEVQSRAELRAWLERHHATSAGIWLVTWKQVSGRPAPTIADIVEELLCFGWIDSRPGKLDADRTMLLCTPRKPRSRWSALNKRRAEALIAAGAMTPAGLAMIELAQRTGTWTALDEVSALVIPEDLRAALVDRPPALAQFEAFPPSARRGILEWIAAAKRAPTRAKRIAETATLAQRGERVLQWPPRR